MRRKTASGLWNSNMHPDATMDSEEKAEINKLTDAIRAQVKRSNESREASLFVSRSFMLMRARESFREIFVSLTLYSSIISAFFSEKLQSCGPKKKREGKMIGENHLFHPRLSLFRPRLL